MDRQELMESIRTYQPFNEQEEMDKSLILNWIETQDDAFSRDNTVAHMTASAWVVNKDRSRVLMVYHNIYDSWSWLGGHADGETDGHVKRGKYVSSHLHLNVTYLLEADSEEQVFVKEDENSGVSWFTPEEALKKSTELWFVERVYGKLVEKMKKNS